MKRNKILPVLLAGAMILTSAAAPSYAEAAPESKSLDDGLTAVYSFEDSLENQLGDGDAASAVTTGLAAYDGQAVYEDGKEGKAVRLGEYGLKLNRENMGTDFTVSVWMKSDAALKDNQSVLFLGHHNPEKWFAFAGDKNSGSKIWANGNGYSWTGLGTDALEGGTWHQLTITGNEETVTAYVDGETVASGKSNQPLEGTNQDIYVGVTNWDEEFTGLADEVKVYDRALTAGEVYQLYDNRTAQEVLAEKGITATDSLKLLLGREETIEVQMPAVVKEADPEVIFESSRPEIASVDEKGNVTGLQNGDAVITVSVRLGDTVRTAETSVKVEGTVEESLQAAYSFEDGIGDAKALVKGLKDYTGDVIYEENGKEGKALRLNGYGLELNQKALGDEYTVSLWLKPDGTLDGNQCVLFLGYHNPEKWLAVSGETTGTNVCKVWSLGGQYTTHTTLLSPTISSDGWHQLTLTGKKGKVTTYLDGISLGTKESNDPLNGKNQDVYLGVNNWDKEFTGLMDEVKIYSSALTETEVQNQAREEFSQMLQAELEREVTAEKLLAGNTDVQNIKYDLSLPEEMNGKELVWTSSNEAVISAEGKVVNPSEETDVTLTVTVSSGTLKAQKTFAFHVAALDRTEIDALIAQAEAVDTQFLTEASKDRLKEAVKAAKEAESYTEIDAAYGRLEKASTELYYVEEYVNPFAEIAKDEPEVKLSMKPGENVQLCTIPEAIEGAAEVEYHSADPAVAVYENGKVTAKGEGKTIVTAVVTAKYDGFRMEYATAVSVSSETIDPGNPDPGDPGNPNPGNPDPGKPDTEDPSSGSGAGAGNNNAGGVKTSDTANAGVLTTLAVLALGTAAAAAKRKRKI